jgi:hypothetical protein
METTNKRRAERLIFIGYITLAFSFFTILYFFNQEHKELQLSREALELSKIELDLERESISLLGVALDSKNEKIEHLFNKLPESYKIEFEESFYKDNALIIQKQIDIIKNADIIRTSLFVQTKSTLTGRRFMNSKIQNSFEDLSIQLVPTIDINPLIKRNEILYFNRSDSLKAIELKKTLKNFSRKEFSIRKKENRNNAIPTYVLELWIFEF